MSEKVNKINQPILLYSLQSITNDNTIKYILKNLTNKLK